MTAAAASVVAPRTSVETARTAEATSLAPSKSAEPTTIPSTTAPTSALATNDEQSTGAPAAAVDPATSLETEKSANGLLQQPVMHVVQPATEGKEAASSSPSKSDTDIEILLLSGARKRFSFTTSSTVSEIVAFVYKEWPESWEEKKPERLAQLRLLHRGRFLPESLTLSSCGIEAGQVTVMHLNIRPSEAAAQSEQPKNATAAKKSAEGSHGSRCCIIS